MPLKFIKRVLKSESGESFQITIPKEIIRNLGLKEKDRLEIWLKGDFG